jgi:hypothetical protein
VGEQAAIEQLVVLREEAPPIAAVAAQLQALVDEGERGHRDGLVVVVGLAAGDGVGPQGAAHLRKRRREGVLPQIEPGGADVAGMVEFRLGQRGGLERGQEFGVGHHAFSFSRWLAAASRSRP